METLPLHAFTTLRIYEAKTNDYKTFLRVRTQKEGVSKEWLITTTGEELSIEVLEHTETLEKEYVIKEAYTTDLLIYTAKYLGNDFEYHIHKVPWIVRRWYMINLDYEAGWTGYGPSPHLIPEPKGLKKLPKFMKKWFKYPNMLRCLKTIRNNMWRVNCIKVLGEDPATD